MSWKEENSNSDRMGWFEAFRTQQGYTWYEDSRTAALVDIPLAAVIYFCALVAIAVVIATLGIRGSEKWGAFIKSLFGVAVGTVILLTLYGHHWQTGVVNINGTYIYRSTDTFEGDVGVHIGLKSANITLRGSFGKKGRAGQVVYSESFPWVDFGHEEDKMYSYFKTGLPDPILKVASYLCKDSGGLRWGRHFHMAGNFALILLWTSFAFWILANILLSNVIIYGAYMMILTGITTLLSGIVYHVLQPSHPIAIHFEDITLRTEYGWCFWLVIVTGAVTILIGISLCVLDHFMPKKMAEFFRVEISIGDDDNLRFDSVQDPRGYNPEKRGSIFQPNGQAPPRRMSIFADQPVKRSYGNNTNGWAATNPAYSNTERSNSCPGKIEEEDETSSVSGSSVHVDIDSDDKDKNSDKDSHVVDIIDTESNDNSTTTNPPTEGAANNNNNSGRVSRQSSDSGNEGSESFSAT